MKILDIPFTAIDWDAIRPEEHKGEAGTSFWRIFERGNIRARRVDYSAGFSSDHWCPRGHVALVLEGEVFIKLKDGREFALRPGMSFAASDDEANPHFVWTKNKSVMFLVD